MEKIECIECGSMPCICSMNINGIEKWAAHCMMCDNAVESRGSVNHYMDSEEEATFQWNKLNEPRSIARNNYKTIISQMITKKILDRKHEYAMESYASACENVMMMAGIKDENTMEAITTGEGNYTINELFRVCYFLKLKIIVEEQ